MFFFCPRLNFSVLLSIDNNTTSSRPVVSFTNALKMRMERLTMDGMDDTEK